jgi:hypothetical protein
MKFYIIKLKSHFLECDRKYVTLLIAFTFSLICFENSVFAVGEDQNFGSNIKVKLNLPKKRLNDDSSQREQKLRKVDETVVDINQSGCSATDQVLIHLCQRCQNVLNESRSSPVKRKFYFRSAENSLHRKSKFEKILC